VGLRNSGNRSGPSQVEGNSLGGVKGAFPQEALPKGSDVLGKTRCFWATSRLFGARFGIYRFCLILAVVGVLIERLLTGRRRYARNHANTVTAPQQFSLLTVKFHAMLFIAKLTLTL
jgi:hypothetical protein